MARGGDLGGDALPYPTVSSCGELHQATRKRLKCLGDVAEARDSSPLRDSKWSLSGRVDLITSRGRYC